MSWFKRSKPCRHEWVIGTPYQCHTHLDQFPAVCRWCSDRVTLSPAEAHIWKEWQRLEIERAKWPVNRPVITAARAAKMDCPFPDEKGEL